MMNKLLTELRRRNIFRVAGVYAVVGWILMQVVSVMTPALNLPDWVDSFFAIALIVGLPIALLLAWAFEMTPDGMKRTEAVAEGDGVSTKTGRTLDYVIVGALVLVGALVIWQGVRGPSFEARPDGLTPQDEAVKSADTSNPHPEVLGESQAMRDGNAEAINTPPPASIAVLAFADLSPGADQAYFSDGIAEEILNVLAHVDGLKVASRTSSFQFKGQEAIGIPVIARALNVRYVLEGSVRKSGDAIRITGQLIDAQTDTHLWSDTFDRTLTAKNVFAIQDEIAKAIVAALSENMGVGGVKMPEVSISADTQNLDAYALYLKAKARFVARGPKNVRQSIRLYEQAIQLDPKFARAWAGLAAAYAVATSWDIRDREYISLVETTAEKAIGLNPKLSLAYSALGYKAFSFKPLDYDRAFEMLDMAIKNDPKDATPVYWRSLANRRLGFFKRAKADLKKCLALDPLYSLCHRDRWLITIVEGDADTARRQIRQSLVDGVYTLSLPPEMLLFKDENYQTTLLFMLKLWVEFGLGQTGDWAIAPLYKVITDPSYDREKGLAALEARLAAQGFNPKENKTFYMGALFLFNPKDRRLEPTIFGYHWHPIMARPENRQNRRRIMEDIGLPEFWRKNGFPPQCRAVGTDDFECD